jgi:hypothetical protein
MGYSQRLGTAGTTRQAKGVFEDSNAMSCDYGHRYSIAINACNWQSIEHRPTEYSYTAPTQAQKTKMTYTKNHVSH